MQERGRGRRPLPDGGAAPATGAPRCAECGAAPTDPTATTCSFCGAALRLVAPPPPSPFGDVAARLAAVRAHRRYDRVRRERPPAGAAIGPHAFQIVFGLVFAAFAVFFIVVSQHMGSHLPDGFGPGAGFEAAFLAIPVLFVLIGVGISLAGARKATRFASAAWESFPALVLDKRTEVSGGGQNSAARTTYFVTIEDEDGRRRECRAAGGLSGLVAAGDVGVAHVRDGHLLGFRPLPDS